MNPPVTHSIDADGIGWIVFDDPASRTNVLNSAIFAALDSAIDSLQADSAKAIVLHSGKARVFIAGEDLPWLVGLPGVEAATKVSRDGQRVLQRLAESTVPIVAAIHGVATGGGFEVALACHWRIAADTPSTQLGLPGVTLGMIPGWGGCVRLPRLIGVSSALNLILKGQLFSASEALGSGLVDELVREVELKLRAKAAVLKLIAEGPPVRQPVAWQDAAWFAQYRATTIGKLRGSSDAALAAMSAVERAADRSLEEALAVESELFGKVTAGNDCKNQIYAFSLREAARQRTLEGWDFPEMVETDTKVIPIHKIGVIGAGVMGSGIAQWCAARGMNVVLRDVQPEFIARGLGVIRELFAGSVKRGKLSAEAAEMALSRITTTTEWVGFADCDLVIEAIVESVVVKQQLFTEIAAVVRPDTLIASNTSALPIEEIASQVPNPERTLGIHFFNPVGRMPLVELILGKATSSTAAEKALEFVRKLGKSPVICRSSPGFLVTRVLFFYLNEACRLWEEGVPTAVMDRVMSDWGWPMGPMRLIDEVGVDVTDFIFGEMAHYFPGRFVRSEVCGRLLASAFKGRKNGASSGFYTYEGRSESVNPRVPTAAAVKSMSDAAISARLMHVMTTEAKRCLDEGVVRTPEDVDFALLSGAGFPASRGGLMRWAAE